MTVCMQRQLTILDAIARTRTPCNPVIPEYSR